VGSWKPLSPRLLGVLLGLMCASALQPSAGFASAIPKWGAGVKAILPAGAGTGGAEVRSVSCASAGNCSAVGSYADDSGHDQGLLLTETAGTWAAGVKATLPAGAAANSLVQLRSVSCASAGSCSAVGNYVDSSGQSQGVLLTQSGGTWAAGVKATLPAGAGTDPNLALESVSCASAGNCTAVGHYFTTGAPNQGLLLTQSGGTWATGVNPTLPAGAAANPNVILRAVSCPSAGDCGAVGDYFDADGKQGLLLTQSAGAWAQGAKVTPPADSNANPFVTLTSVSCASAGDCSTVGTYRDSSNHSQGVLLTQSAGTWATGVEAITPADVGPSPQVTLDSVSCAAAGNCSAVGSYATAGVDASSIHQGLLLTESGGTWSTGVRAALPAGAAAKPDIILDSVSCASAGDCSAVGGYQGSSARQGLLLTESSGTWATGIDAPLPAGGDTALVRSVSCVSPGRCGAVGTYVDGAGHQQGLLLDSTPVDAISLRNKLVPADDRGRFNLKVNGRTVKAAAGDGGEGSATVPDGSHVTVSEAAAKGTKTAAYHTTYQCDGDFGRIEGRGTSVDFNAAGAPVTCTFTNKRRTRPTLTKTEPVTAFRRDGKLWIDTGVLAGCPGKGADCTGRLRSHHPDRPPLRAASVSTKDVGGGKIRLAGGKHAKLVFRLGKHRSATLEKGGTIHLWIDATLHRGTKHAHVRRVVSVTLSG
jgi:hypothetical protein